MFHNKEKIDRMRVASPCPTSWDAMKGDNRARYCDLCDLHVYNISELTRKEVTKLIAEKEGRICARLYKRTDGTVLTKDCPVGLRAIRRRVSRATAATLTAVLSLCTSAFGRSMSKDSPSGSTPFEVTHTNHGNLTQYNRGEILGRVIDPSGSAIASAIVTITNQTTGKQIKSETSPNGNFQFAMLEAGVYTIGVESPYFQKYERPDLKLGAGDTVNEVITLEVTVFVGIISVDFPDVTYKGSGTKTVFTEKQIRSLPF
jgi:hypothetical protein